MDSCDETGRKLDLYDLEGRESVCTRQGVEHDTLAAILAAIKELFPSVRYRHNFYVKKPNGFCYKIDLYFPDHRVALECDERGHKDRCPLLEMERQLYIAAKLGCVFVRYNPDSPDFSPADVASAICAHLEKAADEAAVHVEARKMELGALQERRSAAVEEEEAFLRKYADILPARPREFTEEDRRCVDGEDDGLPFRTALSTKMWYKTPEGVVQEWPYYLPDGIYPPDGYEPPVEIMPIPAGYKSPTARRLRLEKLLHEWNQYKSALRACREMEYQDMPEVKDEDLISNLDKDCADVKGVAEKTKKMYTKRLAIMQTMLKCSLVDLLTRPVSDVSSLLNERYDNVGTRLTMVSAVLSAYRHTPVFAARHADRLAEWTAYMKEQTSIHRGE